MKYLISIFLVGFIFSGCTNTWDGVKKDSDIAWKKTKEVSNEAYEATKNKVHEITE